MRPARTGTSAFTFAAAAALLVASVPSVRPAQAQPSAASSASAATAPASHTTAARPRHCRHQRAQHFLKRSTYVVHGSLVPAASNRAIRYRTERYGYITGFGLAEWNAHPPSYYSRHTTFMGLPLEVHEKVVPVLACVEDDLKRHCASSGYEPRAVGGFRDQNTFRGGEVTNHLYGIAVDIDPDRNPCCGCVEPWRSDPRCKADVHSVYDRMAMPACWVRTFESYGFYWLGHDDLEDTMHFDYLGDPDHIR